MEEQDNAGLWRSSAFPDTTEYPHESGLTKLEYFTVQILSAFVSNPALANYLVENTESTATLVANAVVLSKVAIEMCNEEKQGKSKVTNDENL